MKIIGLLLLVLFPGTLIAQQNCDALNLPTTALTDSQVRAKANAVWGKNSIVRSEWDGDRQYSIKEIGRHVDWKDYDFGFRGVYPVQQPARDRRFKDILGTDNRGSWRRAWNAAMIQWCKQGGTVLR